MFSARTSTALIVALLLLVTGCAGELGTVRHTENDAIPIGIRNEIHALNKIIMDGLLNGDATEILAIYADEVKGRPNFGSELKSFVTQATPLFASGDVEQFHEFDITCSRENPQHIWALVSDPEDGFIVHVNAIRKRMFVSLLELRGSVEDRMLGAHYILEDNSWRLFDLRIHPFRISGRSALEWGHEAKRLLERDLAVPAQLRFAVAMSVIRPLPQIQYVNESKLLELGQSISDELATLPQLPLTLETLPSTPTIYAVSPYFVDRELVAMVQYVSRLELRDDVLTSEVAAIANELATRLPGLCASSKSVAYRAFAEAPTDPNRQYEYYGVPYDCDNDAKPAI